MKKIAIVISQLRQHGSERMAFELASFYRRTDNHPEVITGFKSQRQFYVREFNRLDIPIKYVLVSRRLVERLLFRLNFPENTRRIISDHWLRLVSIHLKKAFEKYDLVICVGTDTYCDTIKFAGIPTNKLRIHTVLHPYQYERNYNLELPQGVRVVSNDSVIIKDIMTQVKDSIIFKMGIFIDVERYSIPKNKFISCDSTKLLKRIGIASRLNHDRPDSEIIELIKMNQNDNYEFFWYGSGDISKFREENELKSVSNLHFRGHAENLPLQADEDGIQIFIHPMHYYSMSYAPIELALNGFLVAFVLLDSFDLYKHSDHEKKGLIIARDAKSLDEKIKRLNFQETYNNVTDLVSFVRENIVKYNNSTDMLLGHDYLG